MYTRIINGKPVWPYGPRQLISDVPGTSFPDTLSDELLAQFDVHFVQIDSRPEVTHLQDAIRLDPVFENGQWVQHWQVFEVDSTVAQERFEQECALVRQRRNELLKECDWSQSKDIPDSVSIPWAVYREELRRVPQQSGFPWEVIWPAQP